MCMPTTGHKKRLARPITEGSLVNCTAQATGRLGKNPDSGTGSTNTPCRPLAHRHAFKPFVKDMPPAL